MRVCSLNCHGRSQQYAGMKDRQQLLIWQLEHEAKRDILPILN